MRAAAVASMAVLIAGCEVVPSPSWQVLTRSLERPSAAVAAGTPDARLEYLQVELGSTSVPLVLGYRRHVPALAGQQVTEVQEHWYSGAREMLVLREGRLEQALGTAVEWRRSRALAQPDWATLLQADRPLRWQRQRDEMPGYRHGVLDEVISQRVDPLQDDVPAIPGLGKDLVWVHEQVRSPLADGRAWAHSQWFALTRHDGRWQVRWSRQCLAPDWCLDLMRPAPPARTAS